MDLVSLFVVGACDDREKEEQVDNEVGEWQLQIIICSFQDALHGLTVSMGFRTQYTAAQRGAGERGKESGLSGCEVSSRQRGS